MVWFVCQTCLVYCSTGDGNGTSIRPRRARSFVLSLFPLHANVRHHHDEECGYDVRSRSMSPWPGPRTQRQQCPSCVALSRSKVVALDHHNDNDDVHNEVPSPIAFVFLFLTARLTLTSRTRHTRMPLITLTNTHTHLGCSLIASFPHPMCTSPYF